LVGRRLEVGIAEATIAPARNPRALAGLGHVRDERLTVLGQNLGSGRHLDDAVVTAGAGAIAAHAGNAVLGLEVLLIAKVDQRVQVLDALDPDVAALAAVTPVRTTELDELLAPETDASGPAIPGADIDFGLVEELHLIWLPR